MIISPRYGRKCCCDHKGNLRMLLHNMLILNFLSAHLVLSVCLYSTPFAVMISIPTIWLHPEKKKGFNGLFESRFLPYGASGSFFSTLSPLLGKMPIVKNAIQVKWNWSKYKNEVVRKAASAKPWKSALLRTINQPRADLYLTLRHSVHKHHHAIPCSPFPNASLSSSKNLLLAGGVNDAPLSADSLHVPRSCRYLSRRVVLVSRPETSSRSVISFRQ